MEPRGLVSRVEEQLERMISLGQLPEDGFLPSEHTLARRYGVSRTTVRQSLGQLAARGLVVQRAGRRSRAVALDETVTLENLGVALPSEGPLPPHRRHLLEGYLALKRQTTVEVLATCCERASKADLDRLGDACFALREAARWQEHAGVWAQREFELLRLAARVADSPGHLLLIHSLERSFWAMAERLLPPMQAEPLLQWAQCALGALADRDAQALRREVLALMLAADERLMDRLAPAPQAADTPPAPSTPSEPLPEQRSVPGDGRDERPDAVCPNLSTCPTGSFPMPPPEPPSTGSIPPPVDTAGEAAPPSGIRSQEVSCLESSAEPTSCPRQDSLRERFGAPASTAPKRPPSPNLPTCPTGLCPGASKRKPQQEPPSTGA